MTVVPTKGVVLEWARNFRGLDEREASERLGIAVSDLLAYESDQKHPSVTLFEAMASKYRLPQATLFLATPPSVPAGPTDFRSLGGTKKKKHSFEFKVALSNIRTWLFYCQRVSQEDLDFVPPYLPQISLSEDAAAAGERERRRLAISVNEQLDWEPREAFGRWRAHLEKVGVLVFQQKFPLEDGRGFSLYETESTPTVVVNKEETVDTAKSFTVWHEYCHLLLREPGVSDQGGNPVEAFCNRFAAAFLIPTEALRNLLPRWPNEPVEWSVQDVSDWARKLKVSRRALAIRLEQLHLAPDGYSSRFAWAPTTTRKPVTGRGNYVATRLSEVGGSYATRLLAAYDRQAIDAVEFSEAIGLTSDRVDDVRHYVTRARELASAN